LRPGADWLACQCESSGTDVLRHARWAYR
jgi:hypothetical protein